jgi:hypothetical protein
MANQIPLVIKSGEIQQLQTGDTLVDSAANPYVAGGSVILAVSGTQNGVNTAFTLTPAAVGTVWVFLNGQLLTVSIDYTVSGTALTFLTPTIPVAGDVISCFGYVAGTAVTFASLTDPELLARLNIAILM